MNLKLLILNIFSISLMMLFFSCSLLNEKMKLNKQELTYSEFISLGKKAISIDNAEIDLIINKANSSLENQNLIIESNNSNSNQSINIKWSSNFIFFREFYDFSKNTLLLYDIKREIIHLRSEDIELNITLKHNLFAYIQKIKINSVNNKKIQVSSLAILPNANLIYFTITFTSEIKEELEKNTDFTSDYFQYNHIQNLDKWNQQISSKQNNIEDWHVIDQKLHIAFTDLKIFIIDLNHDPSSESISQESNNVNSNNFVRKIENYDLSEYNYIGEKNKAPWYIQQTHNLNKNYIIFDSFQYINSSLEKHCFLIYKVYNENHIQGYNIISLNYKTHELLLNKTINTQRNLIKGVFSNNKFGFYQYNEQRKNYEINFHQINAFNQPIDEGKKDKIFLFNQPIIKNIYISSNEIKGFGHNIEDDKLIFFENLNSL